MTDEDHSPRQGSDRDWLIPAAVLVCVALALWLASYSAGWAYPLEITAYTGVALAALAMVLAYRLLEELWRIRGAAGPAARVWAKLRAMPRRVIAVIIGVQLVAIGSSAFGALKAAMPKTVHFWLDPYLLTFEHRLFGMHPFEVTAALFGWATPALELVYASFVPFQLMATLLVLTAAPSEWKTRALVSLFVAWLLLGVAGAYLLSSAGPIFYDRLFGGTTFAGLDATLVNAPIAVFTANQLWYFHHFDVPVIANGISAMPSMHVALTMWVALVAGRARFAWLAWAYCAAMWLGSVHFGFHYAADGLVSVAGILMIWRWTPHFARQLNALLAGTNPRNPLSGKVVADPRDGQRA